MGRSLVKQCAADAHDAGVWAGALESGVQLMLIMLLGSGPCFGKRRATDAHVAGVWAGPLESSVQLMLMMLGCGPVLWKSLCS